MKHFITLLVLCIIWFHQPLSAQTDLRDTEKRTLGKGLPEQIYDYSKRFSIHKTTASGGRISWKTGTGAYLDRYICYNDSDDPIKFDIKIDQDVSKLQNVKLTLSVWDVDEASGEVDVVYVNGQTVGTLHGANDSWSVNNYSISPSILVGGTPSNPGINELMVDLTVEGWCVTVDWGEISADGGQLKIVEFVPGANKLAAFKSPDIHFKFSDKLDEATVNATTVKLQYRPAAGALVDVPSTMTVIDDLLEVDPNSDLKDGVKYTITIAGNSDGVKGKKGDTLAGPQKFDFATIPDLTPDGPAANDPGVYPIQVVKSSKQIREKPTVMRIYTNKWDKKADVHPSSQLEKVKVKVTLKDESNNQITSQELEAERKDLRETAAKRKAGTNTINTFYNWLASLADGDHTIEVALEPKDQTSATPESFEEYASIKIRAGKTLKIVYQYLLTDGWTGAIPAGDKTRMERLMANCKAFFRDNFPVKDIEVTHAADINLATPLASYTWPHARTVAPAAAADGSPFTDTVKNILLNMDAWKNKASGTAFVALIPANFGRRSADSGWGGETDFTGISYTVGNTAIPENNKLIMLRDDGGTAGNGANATTVAHEFGHNYSLSTKRFDGTAHTTDTMPTEGYWVTKKLNKSRTEGNSETALQKSLMSKYIEAENERWICDYDYNELYDNVPSTRMQKTPAATNHLFIAGGYDLWDRFYLMPVWEGEYAAEGYPAQGDLTLVLVSRSGTQIASYQFPSTSTMTGEGADKTLKSFAFFVPSSADLGALQIKKGTTLLKEIKRSASAPVLSVSSPAAGAVWRGAQTVTWNGTDADNEKLLYTVRYSSDGGDTWTVLATNYSQTSLPLATAQLPSGRNCIIRVSATDGTLNYAVKDVALTVDNGLAIGLMNPFDNSTNVPVGSSIEAVFMTPVAESQVTQSVLTLKEAYTGKAVAGTLRYTYSSKTITFTPAADLQYGTRYTATIRSGITDESGIRLGSDVEWNFTTGADNSDLSLRSLDPVPSSSNSPINSGVTATFNKDLNSASVTASSFMLYDMNAKSGVAGSVSYNSASKSALFSPTAPLRKLNEYRVTLTTAITTTDNKSLPQNYEYFFVTGSDSIAGIHLTGAYQESGVDDNNDNLFDWLAIDIDVNVIEAGYYSINGKLADKDNTEIVWASSNNQYLNKGITMIRLLFDGKVINAYRINGPYYLNDLQIYSTSNTDQSDFASSAYTTRAYAFSDFQTSTIPVVSGFTPLDGASDVPQNSTVTATFTRQMNAASIDSTTFYVVDRSNQLVHGAIAYDTASYTATFTPGAGAFRKDSVYRVAVTTGVRDIDNTPLLKQYNWSFTIGGAQATAGGAITELYTYPNPFPHFSLPQGGMYFTYMLENAGGEVKIRIYTITGDLIKDINESVTTTRRGFNQVYWNGLNEAGKTLANGTYLYLVYYTDAAGSEHKEKGKFTVLKTE